MANWCNNNISFSGKYKPFLKKLLKHDYDVEGFRIIKNNNSRCVFNFEEVDENLFTFQSKWAPPIDELVKVANKGKFSFELDYEELGCQIYGRAIYDHETDKLKDYYLTEETFMRVEWDDDVCKIDGVVAESEYDFYESQLELLIKNK